MDCRFESILQDTDAGELVIEIPLIYIELSGFPIDSELEFHIHGKTLIVEPKEVDKCL